MESSWQALCLVLVVGHAADAALLQRGASLSARESTPNSGPQCQYLGQYLPHEKLCRRFYHCGYERFELQCAAGTVWDESLPGCNADRDVRAPTPEGCPDFEEEPTGADDSESQNSSTTANSQLPADESPTVGAKESDSVNVTSAESDEIDSDLSGDDDDGPFRESRGRVI